MRKKWKKVWCILLCMVMVLTAAPMQAYEVKAAENSGNEESTAPELIAEEPSQCSIVKYRKVRQKMEQKRSRAVKVNRKRNLRR